MIYGALTFNSRWISRMYSEWATEYIITSSLYERFEGFLGCGHPSRSSTQASRAGQRLQGVRYPNQNWSSFVVAVFPFIGRDFYRTWPWTTQRVYDFWLTLLKPMTKYQIVGTNERTEVKQYTPSLPVERGIIKLLWHMIMHGSVIRTKFQVCKLQLKHMKLTWQTLEWSWG